jgi:hypothetical protein
MGAFADAFRWPARMVDEFSGTVSVTGAGWDRADAPSSGGNE